MVFSTFLPGALLGLMVFFVLHLLVPVAIKTLGSFTSSKSFRHYARSLQGLRYLFSGPELIDEAYSKANGRPFIIPTPTNNHLMISSNELIKEVMDASSGILSLHAVAKEMLQPKHTMYGFEWQDQRGAEGTGFVRALRSLLTSHLPTFQPDVYRIIGTSFTEEMRLLNQDSEGFVQAKLFSMIKHTVTRVNCFIFFGEDLSVNEEFTKAALEFPQIVILAAEVLRITPGILRPLVASLLTSRHRAVKTLFRHLEPIVQQRLDRRANPDRFAASPMPVDCMQWLIDTSPRKNPWSSARMIGELLAIWFSTVHQLSMTTTYLIEDLCLHEEYVEPLRQEIQEHVRMGEKSSVALVDMEKLPLLDSFIRESMRYTNSDAISCRRKALETYVLQDGSRIEKGDWTCIPQRAMMHDPQRYSNPYEFDGFRFARANAELLSGNTPSEVPEKTPSSLTTTSVEWPLWGLGKTACPGRFYASLVLKLITSQILNEWDCKMPETRSPRSMNWRSSVVPSSGTVVMFRKRMVN